MRGSIGRERFGRAGTVGKQHETRGEGRTERGSGRERMAQGGGDGPGRDIRAPRGGGGGGLREGQRLGSEAVKLG